jgi:AcrR family transcriptional regulator
VVALLDRSKLARAKALKKERMDRILDAGLRAFTRFAYAEVTLDSVRKLAGVPEGKPELYFGSREELFLRVFVAQSRIWSEAMQSRLEEIDRPSSPHDIAAALAAGVRVPAALPHLRSLLPTVLDHIIDAGAVTVFFHAIDDHLRRCGEALHRLCPSLPVDNSVRLLLLLQTYASALYELAHPERAVARLSALENTGSLNVGFDDELAAITLDLVGRFLR